MKMFRINDNTIIYVACPAYYKTGGPELAHQLVYILNQLGYTAYITYYGDYIKKGLFINPAFKKYVQSYKLFNDIKDINENIIIIPETATDFADIFSNIQIGVWWMSVDNFLANKHFAECKQKFGIKHAIKCLIKRDVKLSSPKINKEFVHLYQSEYARQFLIDNNIEKMHRLSDYINSFYFENYESIKRNNDILYNPKKGIKFTKKLIKASKDKLNWIPIQNMTNEEVRKLLRSSKVYIDFGNHPGKDRFPREAAISGCCIITDKKGSAKYYEDVSIPDKYKFDDKKQNINHIINAILYCIYNYEKCFHDFDEYRNCISKEYNIFIEDVKDIF